MNSITKSQEKAVEVYAYEFIFFILILFLESWQIEVVSNAMQLYTFVMSGKRPSWNQQKTHVERRYVQLVETCESRDLLES